MSENETKADGATRKNESLYTQELSETTAAEDGECNEQVFDVDALGQTDGDAIHKLHSNSGLE
jgi:hypothetical protein